jgi:hypothetical protein
MSRYDLFRRRLAPIALLLAIALLARDSCEKDKRTHTTVELQFGGDKPNIRAVDVDIVSGNETIATFHRAALPDSIIGPCRFPLALADEDGELRIDIDLGGPHHRLTRRFHAVEGSAMLVTIPDGDAR